MKIISWNFKGMGQMEEEIRDILKQEHPSLMFIQETKLYKKVEIRFGKKKLENL